MNQYDEFKAMIDAYLNQNEKTANYKSNLHETSFSDAESVYLYESSQRDIEVINTELFYFYKQAIIEIILTLMLLYGSPIPSILNCQMCLIFSPSV